MSPGPAQMLLLDPQEELKFYPPFDSRAQASLEVTNPTPYSIYYKMKTTATSRYCVKPKMGLLLPYSQEVIVFKLKAPKGDTEDKFKLLAFIGQNTGEDISTAWDKYDEDDAMITKFTVKFIDDDKPKESGKGGRSSQAEGDILKATGVLKLVTFSVFVVIAGLLVFYNV